MENIILPLEAIKKAYGRIAYVNLTKNLCRNIIGNLDAFICENNYEKTLCSVETLFGKKFEAFLWYFNPQNIGKILTENKSFCFEMNDVMYNGKIDSYIVEVFLIENNKNEIEFLFTLRNMTMRNTTISKINDEYKKITNSLISLYDSLYSINITKNEYCAIKACGIKQTGEYDFLHHHYTSLTDSSMQFEYDNRFSRKNILQQENKNDIYMEHRLIDGTWIYTRIVFIEDYKGEDVIAIMLIDKIDEKRKKEQEFRDIAIGLETFYAGCAINDLVTGECVVIKSGTPGIEENISYSIDEAIGVHVKYLIHPDDQDYFSKMYSIEGIRRRITEPGQTFASEIRRKNEKGEYAWIEIWEKAYIDENTHNLKVFWYYRYIDELKKIRSSQDNMQRRYVAFVKDTYEKMFEIAYDEDKVYDYIISGGLISFQDSNFNITDYINYNCKLYTHPKYHDMIREIYKYENIKKNNDENRKTIKYDLIRIKDGVNYWCTITLKIYTRTDGAMRVITYIQNTDEEHLQREETINKIKNAKNEAEQANKAKSAFLAQMSHDIRTPMNAVVGMTNMAKKNINDRHKVLECLNKIEASTELLQRLIDDVLDMSKIESGRLALRRQSVRVLDIIEHLVDIIKPQCLQKNQNFNLKIENMNYRQVISDKLRLEQILLNILSNAVKFTPENGNISVTVTELSCDNKTCVYQFSVSDDGVGISEEFIKKLYEPFAREETSLTNMQKGTGLGMAIVKQIVNGMNGTIEVESKKYVGTTFTVTLAMEISDYCVMEGKNESNSKSLLGRKILVVEDIDINMEIIKDFLQEVRIEVVEAWNGKEALDIISNCKKGSFDLILMDIQMPVMDGYEATREIRKIDHDIPIIAMTANAFTQDIDMALDAGMNEHFPKPIVMKDFIDMIKKYV